MAVVKLSVGSVVMSLASSGILLWKIRQFSRDLFVSGLGVLRIEVENVAVY